MTAKHLNILALSAIVFLACSFFPTPITALSLDSKGLHARHALIGHAFAKRAPKRCKARSPPAAGGPTPAAGDPTIPANTPAVTPTNTPATTPPPPAPATPYNSRGKAGLALANWDANTRRGVLQNFNFPRVSAVYDWSSYKVDGADAVGIASVPMLSGPANFELWRQTVLNVQNYAQFALGFNEPDHPEQANMGVDDAVARWWELMMPLRYTNPGIQLISPAVTSSPRGKAWMLDFMNKCPDCVHAHAIHWYGTSSQEFINYVEDWHNTFGKPLWVTEFACHNFGTNEYCSEAQTQQFAREVRAYLDRTPFVERYFPFVLGDLHAVGQTNQLLAGDSPTPLALIYFQEA